MQHMNVNSGGRARACCDAPQLALAGTGLLREAGAAGGAQAPGPGHRRGGRHPPLLRELLGRLGAPLHHLFTPYSATHVYTHNE